MPLLDFMSHSPILTGVIVIAVTEMVVRIVYAVTSRGKASLYCPRCGHTMSAVRQRDEEEDIAED
jgi:DNA replicative helicase MCM subunit Mcm2 (Cdc46/Mcm family)